MKRIRIVGLVFAAMLMLSGIAGAVEGVVLPTNLEVACVPVNLYSTPVGTVSTVDGFTSPVIFETTATSSDAIVFGWTINGITVAPELVVTGGTTSTLTATTLNTLVEPSVPETKSVVVTAGTACNPIAAINTWIWDINTVVKSINVEDETGASISDLDFGQLYSGESSIATMVVTNEGSNVDVGVSVTASVMTHSNDVDTIPAPDVDTETFTLVVPSITTELVTMTLSVPPNALGGVYTGDITVGTT